VIEPQPDPPALAAAMHWPSLVVALVIMVGATAYPRWLIDTSGSADHGMATLLFLAMSTGFVRGVGFRFHAGVWRMVFSGWTCVLTAGGALALKWIH
jgi:predicted membrane protein